MPMLQYAMGSPSGLWLLWLRGMNIVVTIITIVAAAATRGHKALCLRGAVSSMTRRLPLAAIYAIAKGSITLLCCG